MNLFATLIAISLLGQSNLDQIVPEGMDYNSYLDVQFHSEGLFTTEAFGSEDKVVIYNANNDLVSEGNVKFIGQVVDTNDQSLRQLVNQSNFLMEMGNTRFYRLD